MSRPPSNDEPRTRSIVQCSPRGSLHSYMPDPTARDFPAMHLEFSRTSDCLKFAFIYLDRQLFKGMLCEVGVAVGWSDAPRWGLCTPPPDGYDSPWRIDIGNMAADMRTVLHVMAHEMCHVASQTWTVRDFDAEGGEGHGKTWQSWCWFCLQQLPQLFGFDQVTTLKAKTDSYIPVYHCDPCSRYSIYPRCNRPMCPSKLSPESNLGSTARQSWGVPQAHFTSGEPFTDEEEEEAQPAEQANTRGCAQCTFRTAEINKCRAVLQREWLRSRSNSVKDS